MLDMEKIKSGSLSAAELAAAFIERNELLRRMRIHGDERGRDVSAEMLTIATMLADMAHKQNAERETLDTETETHWYVERNDNDGPLAGHWVLLRTYFTRDGAISAVTHRKTVPLQGNFRLRAMERVTTHSLSMIAEG